MPSPSECMNLKVVDASLGEMNVTLEATTWSVLINSYIPGASMIVSPSFTRCNLDCNFKCVGPICIVRECETARNFSLGASWWDKFDSGFSFWILRKWCVWRISQWRSSSKRRVSFCKIAPKMGQLNLCPKNRKKQKYKTNPSLENVMDGHSGALWQSIS